MGGVRMGRVLLVAAVINVLGLVANSATSYLTDRTDGALRWIVPPVLGLAVALLAAALQAVGTGAPEGQQRPPPYGGGYGTPYQRQPVRPRGRSMPVAVLVVLLVCGVGAVGITIGVRYAVGYWTGSESGQERLVQPVSGRAGTLTLRVEKVEYTAHFTRAELVVRNGGRTQVSLPLFGNCVLSGDDGTTLAADSFRSRWSTTVPPGGLQRGTVIFSDQLPDGVSTASLSFSTVFGPGAESITVRNIRLRGP